MKGTEPAMKNQTVEPLPAATVPTPLRRLKLSELLRSTDSNISSQVMLISSSDDGTPTSSSSQHSNSSTATPPSPVTTSSPRLSDGLDGGSRTDQSILNQSSGNGWSNNYTSMSPWNKSLPSPYMDSPWKKLSPAASVPLMQHPQVHDRKSSTNYVKHSRSALLISSLLREDGHVYSLAASGDMLFTGSASKNIRVWKNLKDSGGFKSSSGLVKAIIISPVGSSSVRGGSSRDGGDGDNDNKVVFTGHQDGKIRVWKTGGSSSADCSTRRIGSLPTIKDYLKSSINPRKYVKVRRSKKAPCVRHFDAVSCLCLNPESGLLYSGSWDKTIKVWSLSDSRCLESIPAHDDAINSIAISTADGLVFSGSADGTVKVWRRELKGKTTSHFYVQTLLSRESAITSLAVSKKDSRTVYCGSSDGLVNFWERDKSFWLSYGGVLRGHKKAVLCLATAGGSLVVSGSADKSICVWRREDEGGIHSCISVLTGHSGPVKCLAVEQGQSEELDDDVDGSRSSWVVYSGSLDKSVKVWRVYD